MPVLRLDETPDGLRASPVTRRSLGSSTFTWAELLHFKLRAARVYVLYFPSRFNQAVDTTVKAALTTFGSQTGAGTSVDFWDPTDPEFSQALALFSLREPPAVALATGFQLRGAQTLDRDSLFVLVYTDRRVLEDPEQLASAVNTAHELMVRCDPDEIAGYIRAQKTASLLDTLGRISADLRDQLLKLKPKLELPGGLSIAIG